MPENRLGYVRWMLVAAAVVLSGCTNPFVGDAPTFDEILAAGALLALENDETAGRTYALGGGETLTYRDMIARIFAVLGRPERIVSVSMLPALLSVAGTLLPGSELSGDVAHRMNIDLDFDDGSAGRDFGYAPRPFLSAGLDDLSRSSVQS